MKYHFCYRENLQMSDSLRSWHIRGGSHCSAFLQANIHLLMAVHSSEFNFILHQIGVVTIPYFNPSVAWSVPVTEVLPAWVCWERRPNKGLHWRWYNSAAIVPIKRYLPTETAKIQAEDEVVKLRLFSVVEFPVSLYAMRLVKCVGQPHSGSISSVTEAICRIDYNLFFRWVLIVDSDANTPGYGEH